MSHKPFLDYNQIVSCKSAIYIGNLISAKNEELLAKLKINAVLSVDIYPLPDEVIKKLSHYLHIKLKDDEKEDLLTNLERSCRFIEKCTDEKINLMIHCVAGLSRSPSILIGYLMKQNKLSYDQAFELVRKKRDRICCNDGFKRQLAIWYDMGCRLNINYRPFRLQQLITLTSEVTACLMDISNPVSIANLKSSITGYLARFHDNNQNSGKIIFKCKKCRLFLFHELNVLTNSPSSSSVSLNLSSRDIYNNVINTNCGSIYTEPLKWMASEISALSGILNCTNCFSRIGKFNWYGIDCAPDCVKHSKIVPGFKIDAKKVDYHIL